MQPWNILGIEPTADEAQIRKAYAQLVKQYRPDSHPIEFSNIRSAFEAALEIASESSSASPPIDIHDHGLSQSSSASNSVSRKQDDLDASWIGQQKYDQTAFIQLQRIFDSQNTAAAIAWLDEQLPKVRNGQIDAMHYFEIELINTLLTHDSPPLQFIEACTAQQRWPARWQELSTMVGKGASDRLRSLRELAQEHRFSSQFAANPWQRYLFAPASASLPRVGRTPLLERARKVADSWRQRCIDLGVPGHKKMLNSDAVLHVENNRLQRCDIYCGLLMCLYSILLVWRMPAFKSNPWAIALVGVLVFLVGCSQRLGWRWIFSYPKFQRALPWLRNVGLGCFVLAFVAGMGAREIAAVAWLEWPLFVFKSIVFAYILVFLLWMQWWVVRGAVEIAMTWKLQKMESADYQWWDHENSLVVD